MLDPLPFLPLPTLRGSGLSCVGRGTPTLMIGCVIPSTSRKRTTTARRGGEGGIAAATTPGSTWSSISSHLTL